MLKKEINPGDKVWYVCPFIFEIERVTLNYLYEDPLGTFYIEETGAYLSPENLFEDLEEAKSDALKKLDKFYRNKSEEILFKKDQ